MSPAIDAVDEIGAPHAVLAARAASIPDALERLFDAGLSGLDSLALAERLWTVTAAGIAEGPARFLAQLLGPRARFVPLSSMALAPPAGDALVVFSQGLSPNARIALACAERFRDALLFTSASEADTAALRARGVRTVRLEPHAPEDGMLLRVVGPAVARGAALLFAQAIDRAEGRAVVEHDVAAAVRSAWARAEWSAASVDPRRLLDPLALLAQGEDLDWCRALSWKWMEGLWCTEPPVWDVLQFAHGPLQSVHGKDTTLVALIGAPAAPLFERLGRVLDPAHHTVLRSEAQLPGPLAAFEHDVAINALLVRAVAASAHDLPHWPARDCDGALYGIDGPL